MSKGLPITGRIRAGWQMSLPDVQLQRSPCRIIRDSTTIRSYTAAKNAGISFIWILMTSSLSGKMYSYHREFLRVL